MARTFQDISDLLEREKFDDLIGKGASEDQIREAEIRLKVRLPPSYRQFLKKYGWGTFGPLQFICGMGDDIPHEWEPGINLLTLVNTLRQGPMEIPDSIIPFCGNGAGDWYAFDCSNSHAEEFPVVFIPHEEVATEGFCFEPDSESFADWIFNKLSDDQSSTR